MMHRPRPHLRLVGGYKAGDEGDQLVDVHGVVHAVEHELRRQQLVCGVDLQFAEDVHRFEQSEVSIDSCYAAAAELHCQQLVHCVDLQGQH